VFIQAQICQEIWVCVCVCQGVTVDFCPEQNDSDFISGVHQVAVLLVGYRDVIGGKLCYQKINK